jgi:riboflavin synthase
VFTGIVTELGEVLAEVSADGGRLRIAAPRTAPGLRVGESVAVSGACLTVVEALDSEFIADVMPETAHRTTLGTLRRGDAVNLETALTYGEPVSGHLVSGHVDGVGEVLEVSPDHDSRRVAISICAGLARYIVHKGCIAVDGISLTVVEAGADRFTVALIPHTLSTTTAGRWRPGDRINLEADLMAKYVQRGIGIEGPVPPGPAQ